MFKNILLLLATSFAINTVQAQFFELGIMGGASNYNGDLSPNKALASFGDTHPAFGGFLRYNLADHISVKGHIYYATISADDAKASNSEGRRARNLSFRSSVLEFGIQGEWNILGYQPYALDKPFSPYLFLGVAGFKFKPKTKYKNEWVELQPLGTEGQGMEGRPDPYKLFELSIPAGGGVKYALNDKWTVGVEAGVRKTFTDYLDDVSTTYVTRPDLVAANGILAANLANRGGEALGTEPLIVPTGTKRGEADKKDWYIIGGLTISYNFLDNGLVGSRNRGRRKAGCPTF